MSEEDDLQTRFEDLIRFINGANEKAIQGTVSALNNLEKTIADLCRDVENSDPEMAKTLKPLMAEMISNLDELEQNLKRFRDQQGQEE